MKRKSPTVREKRKAYIQSRLAHFNRYYGFSWNRVTVKNMKSRLGSCSSLRNLNFASKLFSYPPDVIDYVIVHELCHLKEMNHSKNFYALVAKTIPDWKESSFAGEVFSVILNISDRSTTPVRRRTWIPAFPFFAKATKGTVWE